MKNKREEEEEEEEGEKQKAVEKQPATCPFFNDSLTSQLEFTLPEEPRTKDVRHRHRWFDPRGTIEMRLLLTHLCTRQPFARSPL